jgi:hypothetical protein
MPRSRRAPEFAEKHGFTDPMLVQFRRFLGDLAQNMLS